MINRLGSRLLLSFVLVSGSVAAVADTPSVHQVYEAAQSGHLGEAEAMIQQVLREHPESAKAHYVDAEILANSGRMSDARDELNAAERLAPGLPFVKAEAVQSLMASIERSGQTTSLTAKDYGSGFPWGWLSLAIGVLVVVALIVRARSGQRAADSAFPAMGQGGMGSGGYMSSTPAAPGIGANVLSGLATGVALGAGMAAGEELVHHFMEEDAKAGQNQALSDGWDDQNKQLGGPDFGVVDNAGWDQSSNLADMTGGDEWS